MLLLALCVTWLQGLMSQMQLLLLALLCFHTIVLVVSTRRLKAIPLFAKTRARISPAVAPFTSLFPKCLRSSRNQDFVAGDLLLQLTKFQFERARAARNLLSSMWFF
jgi:hypothetical protein